MRATESDVVVSRLEAMSVALEPSAIAASRRFFPIDAPAFGYEPSLVADGDLPDFALVPHGSFMDETLGIPGSGEDSVSEPMEYALLLLDRMDGMYAVGCDSLEYLDAPLPPERTHAGRSRVGTVGRARRAPPGG
jgi:hypothetical protein